MKPKQEKPDLKAQIAAQQKANLEACKKEIEAAIQKINSLDCELKFSLTIDNKGGVKPNMWIENKGV